MNTKVSIEQFCHAIQKCDAINVRRLLRLGVNVNTLTENGITPMHQACGAGDEAEHMEVLKLLLLKGGDPNIKSTDGVTPVHVAASQGLLEIFKVLNAYGGDPWLEDPEGRNAWDLALIKNQLSVLNYLASYMEDDHVEPTEDSVQCIFVKLRQVDLTSISNSSLSCNNPEFLGSDSILNTTAIDGADSIVVSSSNNTLNMAICHSPDTSNYNPSNSSVVFVEEHSYSDAEKGIEFVEWRYPPRVNPNSTDASLNEARCSDEKDSVEWIDESMDSMDLFEQLKTLGSSPGPITPTTKQSYLRQFYRLRREQAAHVPLPITKRFGFSQELETLLLNYPGLEEDTKISTLLDRTFVADFTCPVLTPSREGLAKKSFNYLLLDPRITNNIPLNETQDQVKLFERFVSSIFYIGKGKLTRPFQHLYEAIKHRSRPQAFLKVSNKVKRIVDIWNDGYGIIFIHVFHNSLPVEAYCREAAMIEAVGLSSMTNEQHGQYYGNCTSWSNSDKKRWGCLLLHKAFQIFLHEGERQIRPADL